MLINSLILLLLMYLLTNINTVKFCINLSLRMVSYGILFYVLIEDNYLQFQLVSAIYGTLFIKEVIYHFGS